MTRTRYKVYDPGAPHFLTCTILEWLPVFSYPECADVVLDSWRFLQQQGRLTLFAYVIMENHLHFVASADDLSKRLKELKSYTAREIVVRLRQRGATCFLDQLEGHKAPHKAESQYQVWQEGSHPQLLQGDAMMRQKIEYIHNNPVRRGYVDDPTHWRHSSARDYAGLPGGLMAVTMQW
jgi:putative transposase